MYRNVFNHTGLAITLATLMAACGTDNTDNGGSAPGPSAGTTGGAGNTGATAGKSATAGSGTTTAGRGTGTTTAGTTGSTTNGSTASAGHSGSGGAGKGVSDDDAGVPSAGAPAAGGGAAGSAGSHAGNGGTAGSSAAAGSGGSSASAATFTEVYALFMTSCAGSNCHVGATRVAAGLDMTDKATAYMNLVGANASQCTGEKRVVAGDPDKSELVHSLEHTAVGTCTRTPRMPDDKPMFTAAQLDTVSSWVKAGALNN